MTCTDARRSWRCAAVGLLVLGLGSGGLATAATAATPVAATSVAAGQRFSCALLKTGTVKCWGLNNTGQLGRGLPNGAFTNPAAVVGLSGVSAITAGDAHACALLKAGTMKCWGSNFGGQLGDGSTNDTAIPVNVVGITTATAIAAGGGHTCALLKGGNVKCWGFNRSGVLGIAIDSNKTKPSSVVGLSGVAAISTGTQDSCAVLKTGALKCWGFNGDGQLGIGTNKGPQSCEAGEFATQCSMKPVTVKGISGAIRVSNATNSTCAVLNGGTVKCWGNNSNGQLGNGTLGKSYTPVNVIGLRGVTKLTASGLYGNYYCSILSARTVKCWGYNGNGELGIGTIASKSKPVSTVGLSGVTAISAGADHACATLAAGGVKCWGTNGYGQVGNGTTTDVRKPVSVTGL